MRTVTYVSSSAFDLDEVETAVQNRIGVLWGTGYGFTCPRGNPTRIGDWEIRLTNTQGMGNFGSFVAVALTRATYQLQLESTLKHFRRLADEAAVDQSNWDWSRWTVELGGGHLVPVKMSQFAPKGLKIGQDDRWQYFCHSEENFLNVGKTTRRVWVRPV